MCMIQTYDVRYPDGTRQTSERLVNCQRGTRSQPCTNTTHEPFLHERVATDAEIRAAHEARYPIITPSSSERPRAQGQSRSKPKGFLGFIDSLFGISVRTSPKKSYEREPQRFFVRNKQRRPRPNRGRAEDRQPVPVHHPPRAPTPPFYSPPPPPPPPPGPPIITSSPIIILVEPPRGHRSRREEYHHRGRRPPPQEREMESGPRRWGRPPVVVHQLSSEEESPSPPAASRRHQRRTRSLSPRSRYEEEKRAIRQRERQQHADRIARHEQAARDRAERLAEDERRNRQWEDRQRRLEFEQRRRIESVERARRRRQQEEEERNRRRRDEARRRQEEADRERIQAAERLRQFRQQQARMAEQERLDRLHFANIPRHPRHQPTVHGESLDDQGRRVLREAIIAENLRQFERDRRMPPAAYGRYDGGWLGRRNTVDGRQRRHRDWEGPRW